MYYRFSKIPLLAALSLLLVLLESCHTVAQENTLVTDTDYDQWQSYRGNPASTQYSSLDQINTTNVKQLQVAWEYHTGDPLERSAIQCNPIMVNERLYITSPQLKLIALDAATGQEQWKFDPFEGENARGVNRGMTYWEQGDDQRIVYSAGYYLYVLNAQTGKLITDFGDAGKIDLRQNLGRDPETLDLWINSPAVVYKNLVIVGSAMGEGYDASPGHIRAYNIKTGAMVWIFHTIPYPDEFGYDTWDADDWQTVGGTNSWGGLSLDEKRGWVFAATGSPAFDFYGGNRKGQNLFGNCVLALNAETGERIWHYQIIHHDLWDYDLPCAPNLVTINVDGKPVDAAVQVTKTGHVFVLNRETGEALFPVEERPVPASDLDGEMAWPTQPFPTKPPAFVRQGVTLDDLSDISEEAHQHALKILEVSRSEGIFTPPSARGSIALPGTRGGAEWGGASFDPETGILYVNANEMGNVVNMKKVAIENNSSVELASNQPGGKALFQLHCGTCHGLDLQGQPPAIPALKNLPDRFTQQVADSIIKNGKGQMPAFAHLAETERVRIVNYLFGKEEETQTQGGAEDIQNYQYVHAGWNQFLDEQGYPAIKPPWGTMNAINLNSGDIEWQVPLGEFAALTQKGIPATGTQNLGGSVVTAGGLVFIGATMDEKIRAFDKKTGEILWEAQLPAGGYATPAIYQVDNKQYLVIAAGGGGKCGTPSGDAYVAFSLP